MNYKKNNQEDEDEIILLSGNRHTYPAVNISYYKEEEWDKGRVYINICRDSDGMNLDQFEIFIAFFRKVIEIAQRKQSIMECLPSYPRERLPEIEMGYYSNDDNPVIFMLSADEPMGIPDAERFASIMENLLAKGRELNKIVA